MTFISRRDLLKRAAVVGVAAIPADAAASAAAEAGPGGGLPASGSSQTTAISFVAAGRLLHVNGGDRLRPSGV